MTNTISVTVQTRLHSMRLTEMFKKILSLFLSTIILCVTAIPSFAETTEAKETEVTEKMSLLIIICEPQIELTDYDTVLLRAYHLKSGKSYSFKLYGYNDFADKFMMPEGDYLITELSLVDRNNIILLNSNPNFTVKGSTTVKVPITNTGILISDSTVISTTETPETTYYNPFVYIEETEISSESFSTLDETGGLQEQETNPGLSSLNSSTTENAEDEPQNSSKKSGKIILSIIGIATLAAIAFVIAIKHRIKE